jgi:hypothetical protein
LGGVLAVLAKAKFQKSNKATPRGGLAMVRYVR